MITKNSTLKGVTKSKGDEYMNILFCSAGRRVELLKDFRKSMDAADKIIAADLSNLAPALYVALPCSAHR